MAKFIEGNELNLEVETLFKEAEKYLILISPYIKLHERLISALKTKINNDELKLTIVFGKNEDDISRSMKLEDFKFFTQFPNVEIRYEKRLHAKYYTNETTSILTSMNLYSFSQDNNIEVGVLSNTDGLIGNLMSNVKGENSYDSSAYEYFKQVVDQSDILYKKSPDYESKLMGLSKKYKGSTVVKDKLTSFFELKDKINTENSNKELVKMGYCIRTGVKIPFDVKMPFSSKAYTSWKRFSNEDYEENYCHFSGEESNGKTSFSKPILHKNWKKAQKEYEF